MSDLVPFKDNLVSAEELTKLGTLGFTDEAKDQFIWVAQTFDDHVIIEESGEMFKVGFVEKDGDFIFDGRSVWVEVERKVEFIEKSARAFIKETGINALKTYAELEEDRTFIHWKIPSELYLAKYPS